MLIQKTCRPLLLKKKTPINSAVRKVAFTVSIEVQYILFPKCQ